MNGHQLNEWAESLKNEERSWINLRNASFATIDKQFDIDPNKKEQSEGEIVLKTHDLIPPLEKIGIVKQRALHLPAVALSCIGLDIANSLQQRLCLCMLA